MKIQRGTTLLETMIATGLSTFVLAGVLQIMDSSNKVSRLEGAIMEIQENGRYAMEVLTQAMTYRGFFGCQQPVSLDILNEDQIDWTQSVFTAPVANPGASFSSTNIATSNFRAFDVDHTNLWVPNPATDPTNADIVTVRNGFDADAATPRAGSDVFNVQYANPEASISLAVDMATPTSEITLSNNNINFNQNDLVYIGDCIQGDVFRVSNTPSLVPPFNLEHSISHNTTPSLSRPYSTDAQVYELVSHTYFVGDTGRVNGNGDPIYALFRHDQNNNTEEIIEGVEFLQVEYGEMLASGQVRYISADDPNLNMRKVVSVKLGLLMRSLESNATRDDDRIYVLPSTTIGIDTDIAHDGGRYYRKVFTRTIQLRNRA